MSAPSFPVFATAKVIKGTGIGHGLRWDVPNARIPYDSLSQPLPIGKYSAFASVNGGPVYKANVLIYHTIHMIADVHILHKFTSDFYGGLLRVCIVDFVTERVDVPLPDFTFDAGAKAYKKELAMMERALDKPRYQTYKNHKFFQSSSL